MGVNCDPLLHLLWMSCLLYRSLADADDGEAAAIMTVDA